MSPMHLQRTTHLNVLPTKKEAPAQGTMARQAGQTAAALRLLRNLLLSCKSPGLLDCDDPSNKRTRRSRRQHRRVLLRGQGRHADEIDSNDEEQLRSDGPLLLWRCPVDVLRVLGGEPSAVRGDDGRGGRGGGGEGIPRVPRQEPGAKATGDTAGGDHGKGRRRFRDECLCAGASSGGGQLERGSSGDRVSNVELGRLGCAASGCAETDSQLPERTRSRVHLLQSQSLVQGATTR